MKEHSSEDEASSSSGLIEREQSLEPFRDFATASLDEVAIQKKHRGGVGTHFPTLLHLVLTRAEKDGYNHICGWQPHGRCFAVFNRELFVQEVMPQYFRQSQYASFQRQLNLYGFQRLSQKSVDHGSYYHEMFLRTRADLCQGIVRAKEKDLRAAKIAREEPDFHKMTPMKPITDADILATESILMQQKTGNREGRPTSTTVDESFTINSPSTDPLVSLFKKIMDGIDTTDCWMEPRPIAPGANAHGLNRNQTFQQSQPFFTLPKPEPLPLPSFLNLHQPQTKPAGVSSYPIVAPMEAVSAVPAVRPSSVGTASSQDESVKRGSTPPIDILEKKTSKRKADEISYSDWFVGSQSLEEDVAFLEDVDFD
jgi:hypothetical protein